MWISGSGRRKAQRSVSSSVKRVPTASMRSQSAKNACACACRSALPAASGWSSGMAPLPSTVVKTGARRRSASRSSSASAPLLITPPPAHMTGRRAAVNSRAACAIRSASAGGRVASAAGGIVRSSLSSSVSQGISSAAGRGRPLRICANASRMRAGMALRLVGARPPLGHRREAGQLVAALVQIPLVQPDALRRDLAGDAQNGGGIAVGRSQRRQRVERGRPGRADADADLAAGAGVAVGHEGGALLMAGEDVPDAAVAAQGVVDGEIVRARDAEHSADVVPRQRANDSFTACHAHAFSSPDCAVAIGKGLRRRGGRSQAFKPVMAMPRMK